MYDGEADLHAMVRLVAQTTDPTRAASFHLGDVFWGMYQHANFDPSTHIRVWEDEQGDLLGFAWLDRHGELIVYVAPRLEGAVEPEMLDWAERHARTLLDGGEKPLRVQALVSSAMLIALLEARGYRRDDFAYVYMRQELDRPLPAPAAPAGWTVRSVGGEDEWEERVDIHREVWHPSRVTLEAYRRMQGAAGYTHELDLVAVSPEGKFGSYCIVWYDPVTQIGEFEPVGTRQEYRQLGLGKAVLLEGLCRLRARGARTAIVYAVADNTPAVRLYESVGFRTRDRFVLYSGPVGA
jgi:ribosomal protein S18 acetylase RimI-like enzyme